MPPDRPLLLPDRAIALVIDDAPESLGLVSDALEASGMTVLVARSGAEGIALAQRVKPDVILLDAMMPGMDGFETCRTLKSPPRPEPAPVIFMTGLTEPEHILEGLRSGGVDYITKPVVVDELLARILTHVLNARAINAARSALDNAGQWVLSFAEDGTLSWGSAQALALLDGPAGASLMNGEHAKPALKDWLGGLPGQPMSSALAFAGDGVTLKYLGQSDNEVLICIKAQSEPDGSARLANAFGLTDRESEVLLWLTMGKTNRDIGDILDLSARTINKHLEQVFHKMGVDNRTSAAVMADRILQS